MCDSPLLEGRRTTARCSGPRQAVVMLWGVHTLATFVPWVASLMFCTMCFQRYRTLHWLECWGLDHIAGSSCRYNAVALWVYMGKCQWGFMDVEMQKLLGPRKGYNLMGSRLLKWCCAAAAWVLGGVWDKVCTPFFGTMLLQSTPSSSL